MTKEDIIKLAREAGIDAESNTLTRYEGFVEPLTRFATLIVANLDPKLFMSYQEGAEAGRLAEREECAKVCKDFAGALDAATAIRARGTT